MSRLRSLCLSWFSIACAGLLTSTPLHAGPAVLGLSSGVQYGTVIQGFQDPVYSDVYNFAPAGSATLSFQTYATFPYGTPSSYSGTKTADGGTGYITLPFTFDTSRVSPGVNSLSVTATDTKNGGSITQPDTVNVVAHAEPALDLNNTIVPLTAPIPAQVDTLVADTDPNALAQAPPAGTDAAATFAPQMIGDPPPGVPTAELDLDAITTSGSPFIVTTLSPFTDLPSNDNPAQGVDFPFIVDATAPGDYDTTFYLYYSDEQDLPGAYAPDSEMVALNVNADVTPTITTFTFSTPEPGSLMLMAIGTAVCVVTLWLRLDFIRLPFRSSLERTD